MNACHICGSIGAAEIEKCKLCCDGVEQDFCRECSESYRVYRSKFGTPEANAAFADMQGRREAWRNDSAEVTHPDFFVQDDEGALHAYWDAQILRIHLAENGSRGVRVLSRHHGSPKLIYTPVSCMECFDHDEKCQECCPHDEHDHGHCLDCGKDCTDDLVGVAEAFAEGDR